MDDYLVKLVELARTQFGETEFTYSKKQIAWVSSRKRGQKGSHFMPIGDGDPITQEEYEANITEAKRIGLERFMGRWPRTYWDYYKKLAKPGWREKLIEMITAYDHSASPNVSTKENDYV